MAEPPSPTAAAGARSGRVIDNQVNVRLIELMIAARKAAGIRQTDLAARLERPQSYISKVESRERRIDVAEYVVWMRALGDDPVKLLTEVLST